MTAINLAVNHLTGSLPSKPYPILENLESKTIYEYLPSTDGVDTNLLIIFHGLGDTTLPFAKLAKTLKLPQTAFLVLRAFERVPLLMEEAYQWWDHFDPLTGDTLTNPNPSKALSRLIDILNHLTSEKVGWQPSDIHLFGFAQGGSCAAEFVLQWTRTVMKRDDSEPQMPSPTLGSLVTVSGPLLSLPTISSEARSETPVLLWLRKYEDHMGRWRASFTKGFVFVENFTASSADVQGKESMPRGQEWEPIMRFWSKHLRQRNAWELSTSNNVANVPNGNDEIYQVQK